MNIIQLVRPEPAAPHAAGECVCAQCKHEWVGMAPVGVTQLECPECHTHRGAFKYPFGPQEGVESFTCGCGSETFFIMRKPGHANGTVHCRGCGVEATGWFE
ncbi:hypothetical protein [Pseudomonas typographi]|uniref:hypothetical protein n=1 Tax=Pseudomonas typographi TaxID=2715964 RepID=UPI001684A9AF|nr:hypothetical protein [Pseudomonas typographi]MBD1554784.1 hypothetical protein [Pseudomonas typographi]